MGVNYLASHLSKLDSECRYPITVGCLLSSILDYTAACLACLLIGGNLSLLVYRVVILPREG